MAGGAAACFCRGAHQGGRARPVGRARRWTRRSRAPRRRAHPSPPPAPSPRAATGGRHAVHLVRARFRVTRRRRPPAGAICRRRRVGLCTEMRSDEEIHERLYEARTKHARARHRDREPRPDWLVTPPQRRGACGRRRISAASARWPSPSSLITARRRPARRAARLRPPPAPPPPHPPHPHRSSPPRCRPCSRASSSPRRARRAPT